MFEVLCNEFNLLDDALGFGEVGNDGGDFPWPIGVPVHPDLENAYKTLEPCLIFFRNNPNIRDICEPDSTGLLFFQGLLGIPSLVPCGTAAVVTGPVALRGPHFKLCKEALEAVVR